MENDEKTEIINEYDVEEVSENNGVSIDKPLLAIIGLIGAGIGGFIFFRKRKKTQYVELSSIEVKKEEEVPEQEIEE